MSHPTGPYNRGLIKSRIPLTVSALVAQRALFTTTKFGLIRMRFFPSRDAMISFMFINALHVF